MIFFIAIKGGPLINVFLRVYFNFFYLFYGGFYKHYRGDHDKRISEGFFDVFRQCSRFNFSPTKQSSFYIFGVIVDSRGL